MGARAHIGGRKKVWQTNGDGSVTASHITLRVFRFMLEALRSFVHHTDDLAWGALGA